MQITANSFSDYSYLWETIIDDNLSAYAKELYKFIINTFNDKKISLIKEIRGRGLMIGFVIDHEKFNLTKKTDQNPSIYMVNELAKNGLLTVPAGPDVIRWLPPLNVQKSEVKEAIQIMISTLDKEAK